MKKLLEINSPKKVKVSTKKANKEILLGDIVTEKITGNTGVVSGKVEYLHRVTEYGVTKADSTKWYQATQLKKVAPEAKAKKVKTAKGKK